MRRASAPGVDKRFTLPGSNNVSTNDVDVGIFTLNVLDRIDLKNRIPLGGVDYNNVHPRFGKFRQTLFILFPGGKRGANKELFFLIL